MTVHAAGTAPAPRGASEVIRRAVLAQAAADCERAAGSLWDLCGSTRPLDAARDAAATEVRLLCESIDALRALGCVD